MGYEQHYMDNKPRVLFTGRGELMINDLIQHIPRKFQTQRCAAVQTELAGMLAKYRPYVVVICLRGETTEMLSIYEILEEVPRYQRIPVIAVGPDEDCSNFEKFVHVQTSCTFPRPLDADRFQKTLDEYASQYDDEAGLRAEQEAAAREQAEKAEREEARKLAEAEKAQQDLVQKVEKLSLIQGRKSVLVVDDDVQMLNTIKLYLQDLYDVTVVPSGKLALKFLNKKAADVVLLDYMMPELDGPAVLREIRLNTPSAQVPVLFLTGVSDKDMVMRGLEYHPNGYLLKPVTRFELLERVTELALRLN